MKIKYRYSILIVTILLPISIGVFLEIKTSNRIHMLNSSLGVKMNEIVTEINFLRSLSVIKNGLQYSASNAVEKIITEFINSRPELNVTTIVIINNDGEPSCAATLQQNNLMLPWLKNNISNIKAAASHPYSDNLKYGIFRESKSLLVLNTEIEKDNLNLGELIFIVDLAKMKNTLITDDNRSLDFEILDTKNSAGFKGDYLNTELNGVSLRIKNKYTIYQYELLNSSWLFLAIGMIFITAVIFFIINRRSRATIFISSNNFNMKAPTIDRLIRDLDDVSKSDLAEYLRILHSNCQAINKRLN
jgi:hypothetical protein